MNPSEITYRLEKTSEGDDTVFVTINGKDIPLHSKHNPSRESSSLAEMLQPGRHDVLIILGVGLGYHLLPLKESAGFFSLIICIEILEGIEEKISANRITSFLPRLDNITILSGKPLGYIEDYLEKKIDLQEIRGISVIEHPASLRIFKDYYRGVRSSIERIINAGASNIATRQAFGFLYFKNIISNIRAAKEIRPVSGLFNGFTGYSALVIASGPSADMYIKDIKTAQKELFIVAVDSALPVLLQNDIEPDFIISIDPQPYIYEHYNGHNKSNALVIFALSAHPLIAKGYDGLMSLNSHPLSQIASEVYNHAIGSIDSATGNVAGDAVNFCLKLGFKGIGMVGFDFSFLQFMIYSRGTAYQKRYSTYFQDRFSTVEGRNMDYIMKSSRGFRHEGRFTRRSFLRYKESLENFIVRSEVKKIFNINRFGLALAGAPTTDLGVFINENSGGEIEKSKVVRSLLSRISGFDTAPLVKQLRRIAQDSLYEELVSASLGKTSRERFGERCRNMLLSLSES